MNERRPARRPMTRGPLPPEVYWRRRFFVGALAVTLIFVIGSALSGGSDGKGDDPVVRQAAAEPSATVTVDADRPGRKGKRAKLDREQFGPTAPPTVLAEPDGPCTPDEIVITPQIENAVAGRDVTIGLRIQSTDSEACTWKVDKSSVAVKILDGTYEVWTSRECPRAVPNESVVVRRNIATVVEMTWADARESDRSCSRQAAWAMPGDFTAVAAAFGGEPAETTFELVRATAENTPDEDKASKSDRSDKKSKKSEDRKKKSDKPADTEPRR